MSKVGARMETVTSPGAPLAEGGGRETRKTVWGSCGSYDANAWDAEGSKWFHERIFFTAAGVETKMDAQLGDSFVRVALLQ